VWAERLAALPNDTARLKNAFLLATTREASSQDLETLQHLLGSALVHFTQNKKEAQQLIDTGESPSKGILPAHVHAAWTTVCLSLLNLDETLNR
jgi:hypothetical protein